MGFKISTQCKRVCRSDPEKKHYSRWLALIIKMNLLSSLLVQIVFVLQHNKRFVETE